MPLPSSGTATKTISQLVSTLPLPLLDYSQHECSSVDMQVKPKSTQGHPWPHDPCKPDHHFFNTPQLSLFPTNHTAFLLVLKYARIASLGHWHMGPLLLEKLFPQKICSNAIVSHQHILKIASILHLYFLLYFLYSNCLLIYCIIYCYYVIILHILFLIRSNAL
jgi:hypothetical protein